MVWADPRREGVAADVDRALAAIVHRGPDDSGRWVTPGFAAGMRRLAIIDIHGGHQPVFNETGDVGVVFNGEIYNFRELRRLCESRGHRFSTRSDTEVLVHLYEDFGSEFVRRLDGMFAFALWDSRQRRAVIARDRFGVKPLHLHRSSEGIAFASELKALAAAGWIRPQLDPAALSEYLHYGYVPERHSMWRGAERLLAGHLIEIVDGIVRPPVHYHRHRIGGADRSTPRVVDTQLLGLLQGAVGRQLVADVPVGLFLSGGLDSSLIAALAVQAGADVPCHTIQFRDSDQSDDPWDQDAPHAASVARHLGLKLHVHTIDPNMVDLLPRLLRTMDEPSGDPAMLPAYLIADAARPITKVLLSGMGADELAGGYRRHVAARWMTPFYRLPKAVRTTTRLTADRLATYLQVGGVSKRPFLRRLRKAIEQVPVDVTRFPEALAAWIPEEILADLGLQPAESIWPSIRSLVDGELDDPLQACLAFDLTTYLPSHNLHYMDKATMAASVETRVPFLDNALAEFLLALPQDQKVHFGTTKYALRRVAANLLPDSVLRRPKTGFGAPIRSWLKRELRSMVYDLLAPEAVVRRGVFEPTGVAKLLGAFERDIVDLSYPVWFLLSFEIWCREVMDRANEVPQNTGGAVACDASSR